MGFGSKVFQGAKYTRKQSILECKVCYGVKSAEEQSVPGSKMCWVAKGSKKQKGSEWQRMFRSKVCRRVNCDFAKCVELQSVLCFWEAKCSWGVKCVLVQSVHQPSMHKHTTNVTAHSRACMNNNNSCNSLIVLGFLGKLEHALPQDGTKLFMKSILAFYFSIFSNIYTSFALNHSSHS